MPRSVSRAAREFARDWPSHAGRPPGRPLARGARSDESAAGADDGAGQRAGAITTYTSRCGASMSSSSVFLSGPQYVLGEIASHHTEVADLEAQARERGVPYNPEIWGWGYVHRSHRSLEDLAVEAGG